MQRRLASLFLVSLLGFGVPGCGASDDAETSAGYGPSPYGGQTGSLKPVIPDCGFARSDLSVAAVPSSDSALVYYESGCQQTLTANDVQVVDAAGREVPVTVERLTGGAVLIRADEALAPGAYQVTAGDAAPETLRVGEVAPLPMELGTVTPVGTDSCQLAFDIELDEAALGYVPLMRLDVSFDDGPAQTWVDFGLLEVEDGIGRIEFGRCEHTCLTQGAHRIRVVAVIAGETAQPQAAAASFDLQCSDPYPPAEEEAGLVCSIPSTGRRKTHAPLSFGALGLTLLTLASAFRSKTRR